MRGLPGRGIRVLAALAFVAAMGLQAASAEVKIESRIVEFDVPGTTTAEVNEGLRRLGPVDSLGRRAYATTRSSLRWAYESESTEKGCIIAKVTVSLDITINLPRIVDAARMSPKLKRAYAAYVKNLLGHERGHEKRVVAAAQRIEKRIRAIPPQPYCLLAREKASAVGFDVYQELDQIDRAYDLREQRRLEGDLKLPTD